MSEALNRRSVLRGGAVTMGAAAVAVAVAQTPAAAATAVGPWTYVPPGESIQAAITAGAKAIVLGAGRYPVSAPIVPTAGTTIVGVGAKTEVVATASIAAVFAIGNGGPVDGVYLGDLVIDCARLATTGVDLNIVGTTGNYKGEPDSICRLDNLRVYAPVQDGVWYRGSDCQAVVTTRVRVRQAGRHGFRVESADNWWSACEATTSTQTGSSAGFSIAGANNFFESCKAWYCRDYGFHVRGVRNQLSNCSAQDIRSHGFFIEFDKNVINGCTADSCGHTDVGGTPGTADGFYVTTGDATSMVGCQSYDRKPGGVAIRQRYGFNVPGSMIDGGRFVAASGYDNLSGLVNRR